MHVDQAARLREIAHEVRKEQEAYPFAVAEHHAKIIAVASGKGGVGKTNLSVNLAISLAKKNKKVVLVDLDLGLANVDILFDLSSSYSLEHLLQGYRNIEEIIVHGPEGVHIVPGGSGLPSLTDLDDGKRELFLRNFFRLAQQYDYVIFDTAAGISENVIRFSLAADEVLVVTTEEPTAITDAYALMKVLSKKKKDIQISVVFNMVKHGYAAEKSFEKIESVVKRFLNIQLGFLGYVPRDTNVPSAIMRRTPFVVQYPLTVASLAVKDIAKNVLRKESTGGTVKRTLLQKVSSIFFAG